MTTNFFWIGYHFEEFRSQVAFRKKKSISRPEEKYRFLLLTIQWQVDWISVYKYLLGSVFGKDDLAGRKMELLFANYQNVNYAVIWLKWSWCTINTVFMFIPLRNAKGPLYISTQLFSTDEEWW